MATDSLETTISSPAPAASSRPAPRPRLGVRVGVTGHRTLNAELRDKVRDVLESVRRAMKDLARDTAVGEFYVPNKAAEPLDSIMRVLSPLASGADRLVAEVALDLGYELYVPMPFARDEYKADFQQPDGNLQRFEELFVLAGQNWLALDGDPASGNRAYGYENVGRFVVRHSDVLIAIWDGKPAAGRGGTAEIVYYAASNGVPVWWIHANDASKPPVWIADAQDLRDPLPAAESAKEQLRSYLERQVRPPKPLDVSCHGRFEKMARWRLDPRESPVSEYYAEQPRPVPRRWRIYNWLMREASGCDPPWTPARRPKDPVAAYWFDFYQPADERAGEYAKRYRSTYVWIFILATFALLSGVFANVFHSAFETWGAFNPDGGGKAVAVFLENSVVFIWTFLELVLLAVIFAVVMFALRGDWHRRSIEYRLLAELYRKQQVLAPLGNAVSLGAVRHIVDRLDSDLEAQDESGEPVDGPDRAAWVAWVFAACQRAAPLPHGDAERLLPEAVDQGLVEGLIEEQLQYHRGRRDMARAADKTFETYGGWSFIAVIAAVLLKLAAIVLGWGSFYELLFGSLAVGFAAISAAFVGIRSYAELQLLGEQSHHMLDELQQAKARVERIRKDLPRPLAFQDLGAEAQRVAILMLQDLEGWARLFRGKAIEP
jgi:hypothetical protein